MRYGRLEWPEGRLGMLERSEDQSCSVPPDRACNLWTQELHANRIQALTARPETDKACRLAPIGVECGVPNENCRGSRILKGFSLLALTRRQHHDSVDALLIGKRLDRTEKLDIGLAVSLEVDDYQARPNSHWVGQGCGNRRTGSGSIAIPLNAWCTVRDQHTRQQSGRVLVIVDERDVGRVIHIFVQSKPRCPT
ncbi:MAG: hypothetical protein JWQ22_716 [Devosia sp.]|nr:hypothetical protein [Devosia sp.]